MNFESDQIKSNPLIEFAGMTFEKNKQTILKGFYIYILPKKKKFNMADMRK